MTTPISASTLPASIPATRTTTGHIGDFASLLLEAAHAAVDKGTPGKPTLAGLSDYLGSLHGGLRLQDINAQANSLVAFVVARITERLEKDAPGSPPVRLELGKHGQVEVGDHPEKAKIEQLLSEHPEWRQALYFVRESGCSESSYGCPYN
ncbi:MAG: hypothetical protein K2Q01_03835, partial [Rickettsiales bacterium]|nr:hypothetical protein [Rickettsiales bacterium]